MNPHDFEQREELLVGLMADYDEALASNAPTESIDDTVVELDPQLAAKWENAKKCLELMDRVSRSGDLAGFLRGTSSGALTSLTTPPRRLGRFVLERELGRGGLGIVYLADDPQLGRKVAVKIPRFEALLEDDLRERFLREAEAAARLNHPHLVALYEVGEDGTTCYLASEYCSGPTLAEWLRERKSPVPFAEAAKFVSLLAEAVEHAHSRGVLHRDIKPSNVLLSATGDDHERHLLGSPKLTDFGMAKLLEQGSGDRTRTGAILGTLAYMAPEQLEGRVRDLDVRTDVYALGAILYELLTGIAPYSGQSDVDIFRKVVTDEPPAPRKSRPDVPRDLEAIALKCLARCAAQRYATAHELAADLNRFLQHKPTAARPLSATEKFVKWARRRPAIAALCLLSALTTALVFGLNARRVTEVSQALEHSESMRLLAEQERQHVLNEQNISRRLVYVSRMRQAQQAWRDGDLPRLRSILQYYAEGTTDAMFRHFEWYHLNYLASVPHQTLRGHEGEVYAVAYAPDGKRILTGGQDGVIRLWDAVTGSASRILHEHTSCVNSIDFAPDGDTFATASCDKTIKIWSLRDQKVLATLAGSTQEIDACYFIDEGKTLVAVSRYTTGPREVQFWDVATRSPHKNWLPRDEGTHGVAVSRSGKTLLAFANGGKASVWNRNDSSWVLSHRLRHMEPTAEGLIPPDEDHLLMPGGINRVRRFQLQTGALVNEIGQQHTGKIVGLAISPDGKFVATASGDSSIRVLAYPAGTLIHNFLGHQGVAWRAAWAPDGKSIASVGTDGTLRIWDLQRSSSHLSLSFPEKIPSQDRVYDLAYLKSGQHVNVVSQDDSVVYDLRSGELVPPDEKSGPLPSSSMHLKESPPFSESTYALVPQWDALACLMPAHFQRTAGVPKITISCVRILNDGSKAAEFRDGRLRIWKLDPLELLEDHKVSESELPEIVFDIAPDGKRLCGSDADGRFRVFDLQHKIVAFPGVFINVRNAKFSPNGERVLILAGTVQEYDAHTGRVVHDYGHARPVAAYYSADGQRVAIASEMGSVGIYDTVNGEETLQLDEGGNSIVFSADGTSLLMHGGPNGGLTYWPGMR